MQVESFPMSQVSETGEGDLVEVRLNAAVACAMLTNPGPSPTIFLFVGSKLGTTCNVNLAPSKQARHLAQPSAPVSP
jgi:hypothetical protein